MQYTVKEYQAFYYLNLLMPLLNEYGDKEDNFIRFNRRKKGGLLVKAQRPKGNESSYKYEERMFSSISAELEKQSVVYPKLKKDFIQENIHYLVRALNLSEQEERIIDFFICVYNNDLLKKTLDSFRYGLCGEFKTLEYIAQVPRGGGISIFGNNAPLRKMGILSDDNGLHLSAWAISFLSKVYKSNIARKKAILGIPVKNKEKLSADEFSYIEGSIMALNIMKQAVNNKGINILLYGRPGTGKTSFAKVLADYAKTDMYCAGEGSRAEKRENYRLGNLYRRQYLLENIKNSCILFDEAEDVFSSSQTSVNKVELNRLLEENTRPVIWTTNNIRGMDRAFIRRFTLALCFTNPSVEIREKIWNKYVKKYKLCCPQNEISYLAKTYEIPPSMINGAVRAAVITKGGLNAVKEHICHMQRALNGGFKEAKKENKQENFFPSLIYADMDLSMLTSQLKQLGRLNFSLCLYGASGTGKSAYARYLAGELGLEIIHRRGSDLLGPYVGETEHNIANAFAEAKERKALLIFDEADSFLRDRSRATHSWEVSGVNEMLTWMESHPYPFICTTNLMDTLDTASLRRFSFKVKYDFLTSGQVQKAFDYFFGLKVCANDINNLTKLTPGDFTLVKNKAEILGKTDDFTALKEMLESEQKLKQNNFTPAIGFKG